MGFSEIIHQYSGVIIGIAVTLIIIAAIVILGTSGLLGDTFKTILDAFITKAQSDAGF